MRRPLRLVAVFVGLVALAVTLHAAASYPSATKSFTTKTDGPSQTIFAAHINEIQDEIVAIENALLTGLAHNLLPDGDVTRSFGSNAKRWLHPSGTVTAPGVAVGATGVGMYSSGTNALELGTNGTKALGIDSTQFIDSPTQPRVSAYMSTTQTLTSGVAAALTFDTEEFDVAAMHDTAVNTSRVTVPTGGDGLYLAIGQTTYAANATGIRQTILKKNGTTNFAQVITAVNTAASITSVQVQGLIVLAATDYVELLGVQNSGGNLAAGSASREAASALQLVKLW